MADTREVCGWRDPAMLATFGDGVRICSGTRFSHEGVVRDHEYEPVLIVPLPLDYALGAQVIDVPSWAANETWWDVARRVINTTLRFDDGAV